MTNYFEYLNNVGKLYGSSYGTQRTRMLLDKIGAPDKSLKIIHVVGTNGKGSTCHMLQNILVKCGIKVGLFTSPAVFSPLETWSVNGETVATELFELCAKKVISAGRAVGSSQPTRFELETAIALEIFAHEQCEIVILEAGLGGKEDATNAVDAASKLLTAVCDVSLDHTAELGGSLGSIIDEKIAICGGSPIIKVEQSEKVDALFVERGITPVPKPAKVVAEKALDLTGFNVGANRFVVRGVTAFQPRNATLAISVAKELSKAYPSIKDDLIAAAIAETEVSGRFERICGANGINYIIDGAHNPGAAASLAWSTLTLYPDKNLVLVIGMFADKNHIDSLRHFLRFGNRIVCVPTSGPRGYSGRDLAGDVSIVTASKKDYKVYCAKTVKDGIDFAAKLATSDETKGKGKPYDILVCGSLSILSEAKSAIPV